LLCCRNNKKGFIIKFSKIFARVCAPASKPGPEKKPPELEFYLSETDGTVELRVRDVANNNSSQNYVISILKSTGLLVRCSGVNPEFGLPLDNTGQLKFNTER
tara:strand:- start:328 stop:636 length:309 start_codon:yes stop_codon:yes gene_type:complete